MDYSYIKFRTKELFIIANKMLGIVNKTPNVYASKHFLSIEEGNLLLRNAISLDKPYLAGRLGYNESQNTTDIIVYNRYNRKHFESLCLNAGFFPNNQKYLNKYARCMIESIMQMDLAACFFSPGEEFLYSKYARGLEVTANRSIEPWYSEAPWTLSLEGKKVLVVHPFARTIEEQYEKREYLFENKGILPKFDLKTFKAVQTIAGNNDARFETWFDALDYMYHAIMKIDFEVAIVGCGAYGLPLAASLKKAGKKVVHMGGATQILFGIKGKRWDTHPSISKLYNEYWIRPREEDMPHRADLVENGCYW